MKLLILILFTFLFSGLFAASSYELYYRGKMLESLETIQLELKFNSSDSNLENKLELACDVFSRLPSVDYSTLLKIYQYAKKHPKHQFLAYRIDAMIQVLNMLNENENDSFELWNDKIDDYVKMKNQKNGSYQHYKAALGKVLWLVFTRKKHIPNYHYNWDYLMGKLQYHRNLDGSRELVLYIDSARKDKNYEYVADAKSLLRKHYSRHYPSGIPKDIEEKLAVY